MIDPDVRDWERLRKAIPAIEVPPPSIDESLMKVYLDAAKEELHKDMIKTEWWNQHEIRKSQYEWNERWGSLEWGRLYPCDDQEKENSIDVDMAKSHYLANSQEELEPYMFDDDENAVNNPNHYTNGSIECIEGIQASMSSVAFKGFLKGNVQKYLWRYEMKGKPVEDLQKAQWYLAKLIKELLFEDGDK